MVTLAKPFPGDTPQEILRSQLNGVPIPPRQLNPDIPPALENVILKCLERDPAERYPLMTVVVPHLEQALYLEPGEPTKNGFDRSPCCLKNRCDIGQRSSVG